MREIKFRVWNKYYKKFEEGDMLRDYFLREFIDGDNFEVIQYTGLKDKNGKEIYDGDILQASFDEMPIFVKYSTNEAAFVFVDKFARFGTEEYKVDDLHYEAHEVISNIYENPELLEEMQK